jgi:predicted nucleic acid-binding protein
LTATHCTSGKTIYTLDTNVLIYSIDRSAGLRHELAKDIVRRSAFGPCHLTLQAISEFFAVATRKNRVPPVQAARIAEAMIELFPTIAASAAAVRTALTTAASGRASYWDALLVNTAAEAGCTAILTDDLSDGTVFDGMRIINPFAGALLSAAAEALLIVD